MNGVKDDKKNHIMIKAIIAVLFVIYMMNDGIYLLALVGKSKLALINTYGTFGEEFPPRTTFESFHISYDPDSNPICNSFTIEAILHVPNETVNALCPPDLRDYEYLVPQYLITEGREEPIYTVTRTIGVTKWFFTIPRWVHYTVLSVGEQDTRIYVSIDRLGWKTIKD